MAIIDIEGLAKSYRVYQKIEGLAASLKGLFRRRYREVKAVRGIELQVEAGEFVAFLGPNGAGKTTLVNAVTGIYEPSPGASVKFRQKTGETTELLDYRPHQIARMGSARTFQNLGVFSAQTVLDNLMLGRFMHERTNIFHYGLFSSVAVKKALAARSV